VPLLVITAMKKGLLMRCSILIATLPLLLLSPLDVAIGSEPTEYVRPELLAEPDELLERQEQDGWIVLDARAREDYDAAHVPGALWVDHDEWSEALNDHDAADWSRKIGNLGIEEDSVVVVYDDNWSRDSARIWWILRYWGVEEAKLLNGGWSQWGAEDRPTSTEPAEPTPAQFTATAREERFAARDQVLQAVLGNAWQIVDARSEDEFCGIDQGDNQRGGAIPGAVHLEWQAVVDDESHRYLPPADLLELFDQAGIDLQRPSATHCQSGGRSAVMVFAMELMGAETVRNYYQGWSEWGNREDTPIVIPERP